MVLAQHKRQWPTFPLSGERGAMSAVDVMAATEGGERSRALDAWCVSVWQAFRDCHRGVADLLVEFELRL